MLKNRRDKGQSIRERCDFFGFERKNAVNCVRGVVGCCRSVCGSRCIIDFVYFWEFILELKEICIFIVMLIQCWFPL